MSKLTNDLKKYADGYPSTHIKNKFFNELVLLLEENQLTVSLLTSKLATLTAHDRKLLFNTFIASPLVDNEAEAWIQGLYTLMGVPLKEETLELLIKEKPSQRLISYLGNSRYRLWQKSPFNENRTKKLEHELKGAIGLLSKENEGESLANLLGRFTIKDFKEVLPTIVQMAPDYLPILLDQMYQKSIQQQEFVEELLDSDDLQGNLLHAFLNSSPAIVAKMVIIKPELYFKASESMRTVVHQLLIDQKEIITLNQLFRIANSLFASESKEIESQRLQFVIDGSYRFKEVRLSQTEQALNAIRDYLLQQPNEYKKQFFHQLEQDIQAQGLTVDLLQEHLSKADTKMLFAKWSGLTHSRASGLMASLYKLASFGIDLNADEVNQMVESKQLPKVDSVPDKLPGTSHDMAWLQEMVASSIQDEANILIAQDQTESALTVIQNYLAQQPNEYKAVFFNALYRDIATKGLTLDLLQEHLSRADNKQLFSKWSGLEKSRAAEIMALLYHSASFGKSLDSKQFDKMVYLKQLPLELNSKASLLNGKIREIIMNPDRSNTSYLAAKIGHVFEDIQAKAQFIQDKQYNANLILEATYQKYLLQKGLIIAEAQANPVFDLQGRVMVFVSLDEWDYRHILRAISHPVDKGTAEATFKSLLGSQTTNLTLCNLDIKNNRNLEAKFKQWTNNDNASALLMNSEDKSSIIGLQEEMTLHVLLSLRTFEKKISSLKSDTIRLNLVIAVNDLVKTEFRSALNKAYSSTNNQINYDLLNKELDAARTKLAPLCLQHLTDMLFDSNQEIDWDAQLSTIKKHDFTSTTATGLDYLRSDVRNETLVRISATEFTAHDKSLGANTQALRVLHRTHYEQNKGDLVSPNQDRTLEARVPSIAVKESSQQVGIKDVADKLQASHRILREQVAYSNGPMVYNLLTSLHTLAYDNFFFERPNKQRLSAEYILHGSHQYNLSQLRLGESKALVYVQNIPVNQHTNELDDSAFDDVTKEATLMTDIALLSTFNHYAGVFPSPLHQSISRAYNYTHQQYLTFLPQVEHKESYFYESNQGILVTKILNQHKAQWSNVDFKSSNFDNLNTLVVQVLFKMYSSDDYRNKQFGMLAQSLSVFVEPLSQAGCKSANERYQGVSGRVELLKSISARSYAQLSLEEKNLKGMLQLFVNGEASCAQLQQSLDTAYNKHNLYGAAVVFSEEDQGAASKVKATKNKSNRGVISELDTNVAESGFLTRLHQSFCSVMQAHKANLTEQFKKLFHEKIESSQNEIIMK